MTEENRQQAIQAITKMLQVSPFQVEYKVKKRPQGIKVIIEVTQEQMDATVNHMINKKK